MSHHLIRWKDMATCGCGTKVLGNYS